MPPPFMEEYEQLGRPVPMPKPLKFDAILHYKGDRRWFVETGTYTGVTLLQMAKHFPYCHSIEVSKELAYQLHEHVNPLPDNVTVWVGPSYELLYDVMTPLPGPRLFWLDAHGAQWAIDLPGGKVEDVPECSVIKELQVLLPNAHPGDVILIDDANVFGTGRWPSVESVFELFDAFGYTCRQEALLFVCEVPE